MNSFILWLWRLFINFVCRGKGPGRKRRIFTNELIPHFASRIRKNKLQDGASWLEFCRVRETIWYPNDFEEVWAARTKSPATMRMKSPNKRISCFNNSLSSKLYDLPSDCESLPLPVQKLLYVNKKYNQEQNDPDKYNRDRYNQVIITWYTADGNIPKHSDDQLTASAPLVSWTFGPMVRNYFKGLDNAFGDDNDGDNYDHLFFLEPKPNAPITERVCKRYVIPLANQTRITLGGACLKNYIHYMPRTKLLCADEPTSFGVLRNRWINVMFK